MSNLFLFFENFSLENIILIWLIIVGLMAFVLMGYDKLSAKLITKRRVPEKNLWLVSALGGFAGVYLGAILFHHKVSKLRFWPPVFIATLAWIIVLYSLYIL